MAYFVMVTVGYLEGEPETYVLPLAAASGEHAGRVQKDFPQFILARLKDDDGDMVVYEPVVESQFQQALLQAIDRRRRFKGTNGELVAVSTASYRNIKRLMKTGHFLRDHERGAEQYFHCLWRVVDPQTPAAGRGGREPGPGNRPLPHGKILLLS